MADSRLTDLPNFTEIDNNDILYIVDVSQDTSNKITYGNLIGNRIDTISNTIDSLGIPNIASLTTKVATLSVIQKDKADQSSLNATNVRVDDLETDNTTNKNNIAQLQIDTGSLSGTGIAGKAPLSAIAEINSTTSFLSTQIDTKATTVEDSLKVSQSQFDSLSSLTFNLSSNMTFNAQDIDILQASDATFNSEFTVLSTNVNSLSTALSGLALNSEIFDLSAGVLDLEDAVDDIETGLSLSATVISVPFDINVQSNTNVLCTYTGLTGAQGLSSVPIEPNILGTVVTAYISSGNMDRYLSMEGLITQTVVVSSGGIQFNAFNPTGSTITFNDETLIFYVDNVLKYTRYIERGSE